MLVIGIQEITASFDGSDWACDDEGTIDLLESATESAFANMPMPQFLTSKGVYGYVYDQIEPYFPGIQQLILTNPDDGEELEPGDVE